jgi:hypothetical protein
LRRTIWTSLRIGRGELDIRLLILLIRLIRHVNLRRRLRRLLKGLLWLNQRVVRSIGLRISLCHEILKALVVRIFSSVCVRHFQNIAVVHFRSIEDKRQASDKQVCWTIDNNDHGQGRRLNLRYLCVRRSGVVFLLTFEKLNPTLTIEKDYSTHISHECNTSRNKATVDYGARINASMGFLVENLGSLGSHCSILCRK